jgi:hypothetical protein
MANKKIGEDDNYPVYVYFDEGFDRMILWMVFYNGIVDAVELLMFWLEDAVETYLDGLTVTVIEDDPLDV